MDDLEFYINPGTGFVKVPPPMNWEALMIEMIWTNGNPSASVEGTDFEWVGDNAELIWNYRNGGLTGATPGIMEGLPLQIKDCINNAVTIFDGFINLADRSTKWECDIVRAPSRESGKIDVLNDIFPGYTFHYLRSLAPNTPGRIIPSTDFKLTPYAQSEIPDYTQAAVCGITLFLMVKELQEAVTKVSQLIAQLTGDAATAVATAGLASGTLLARIAMIALQVTYLFLIIIALVQLMQDLIDSIIQRKKYKACMTFKRGFERICQYFGWQFSTNILTGDYVDTTWMPRKSVMPDASNPLNVFSRPFDEGVNFPNNPDVYGHHDGTFKDFVTDAMTLFDGEIKLFNNVLYFNKKRSLVNISPWQIPNESEPGFTHNLPEPHTTNAAELPSSLFVIWQVDPSDLVTLHRYQGTSVQILCHPINTSNKKNLIGGTSMEFRLPCAHGNRKEYLTRIEILVNGVETALATFANFIITGANVLINGVNAVLSLFGGNAPQLGNIPTLPTNTLGARVDWLIVSNDSFSIPKVFIGRTGTNGDWVIHPASKTRLAAAELANNFHGLELPTRGAQALIYSDKTFKFCCQDYLQLLFANYVKDPTGVYTGEMLSLKWNRHQGRAINANYKIYRNFTNNLTETIIIDGNS